MKYKHLAWLAVGLGLCVVVLGAFVRLSDAGLGCPDWPGCYGHLTWPTQAEDIEIA
ncbi:MAG: COX15/CtaA family protein, partial [Proteobacteria bacterium]|nr:COX15/CtaA family protein [Pseudomonadota bacterium]